VIEGIGSGIATVFHALSKAGMTAPSFIDAGVRFTAIMPDHALLDPEELTWLASLDQAEGLGDTARHVLVTMKRGDVWTNKSLRNRFPMDSTRARALLSDLVERGLAEAIGEARNRRYRLKQNSENTEVAPRLDNLDNRRLVWDAIINGNHQIAELIAATGLQTHQVRYALNQLRKNNQVILTGGKGQHATGYYLAGTDGLA
jgi:ATP-dependent DNA helicase RecG